MRLIPSKRAKLEIANRTSLSKSKKVLLVLTTLILIAVFVVYRLAIPGALFLQKFMDKSPAAQKADQQLLVEHAVIDKKILVRIYKPQGGFDKVMMVVHGAHYGGYDEPRLVHFSKRLADFGYAVVTPEIQDLKNYEIGEQAVYDIVRSAKWTLDESGLISKDKERKIGLMGISFAGGLCLSAATLPEIKGRIRFVFAFGGHADLDETTSYLATGNLPGGGYLKPHIYGQAVLIRKLADRLVPPIEVEPLKSALLEYLEDRADKARQSLGRLGPASKKLVELCLERRSDEIGKVIEPRLRLYKWPKLLSPAKTNPPNCPVFLLHGSVDNVIPPSQTIELNIWASKSTETTALVSELIKHVELEEKAEKQVSWLAYWNIIRFFTELLRS